MRLHPSIIHEGLRLGTEKKNKKNLIEDSSRYLLNLFHSSLSGSTRIRFGFGRI